MNEIREQVEALNRPIVTAAHLLDMAEIEMDSGNAVAATKCLDEVGRLIEEVGFNENSSVAVRNATLRARLAL